MSKSLIRLEKISTIIYLNKLFPLPYIIFLEIQWFWYLFSWCPLDHVGFLCSFILFLVLWLTYFKILILLLTESIFCLISSAVDVLYCILISFTKFLSTRISVWFSFIMVCISFKFLISFLYCSSWNFFKKVILNYLLDKSHISVPLGSVTRGLLWSFDQVMFPWLFAYLEIVHCCFGTWRSWHLHIPY